MSSVCLKRSKRSAARKPRRYIMPEFNFGLALAPAKIYLPPFLVVREVNQAGLDALDENAVIENVRYCRVYLTGDLSESTLQPPQLPL